MYLSSISYTYGEQRLIRELGEDGCDDARLKEERLEHYRATDVSSLDMARDVGARTLAAAGGTCDLILFATETRDGPEILTANAQLANALGLPGAIVMSVGGHACGNLGLLLQLARGLVATSAAESILIITSDRVVNRPRMMAGALSVLSDGAAAAYVSRERPAGPGPTFVVHGVAVSGDSRGGTADASPAAQLRTVQLGRAAAKGLKAATGRGPRDFTRVLFNNYRTASLRFLTGAAGFLSPQLLIGPVAEYAHSYAADLLTNLALMHDEGAITAGDRLALAATGPHSWAMIDVEVAA
ncbi:hypothetical protein [Luedemannella helvata]